MKRLKNNKGVALMIAVVILLFLCILSAASFMSLIAEKRIAEREKQNLKEFYSAEEGIYYGYAELKNANFDWRTHNWNANKTQLLKQPSVSAFGGAYNSNGTYYIPGKNFRVVVYPEVNAAGELNDVMVIRSQGLNQAGKAVHTLELRISRNSLFDYFYYFPNTRTFNSAIYDGSGYGKIHVDGTILFTGSPIFRNLLELSTTSAQYGGHFRIANTGQYSSPLYWDTRSGSPQDGIALLPRDGAAPYNYYILGDEYGIYGKFGWGGSVTVDGQTLPYDSLGQSYPWDKYSGDKSPSEVPIKFLINNDNLTNLAYVEHSRAVKNSFLLSDAEYTNFAAAMYSSDPATNLATFWQNWKNTHGYTAPETDTTGAMARKYWEVMWNITGGTMPGNVNPEWWADLTYGNDRSSSDYIDINYLNTHEQGSDWLNWLQDKTGTVIKSTPDGPVTENVNLSDVLKDGNNGAQHVVPVDLQSNYKQSAQQNGIYLNKGSGEFDAWAGVTTPLVVTDGSTTITLTMTRYGVCLGDGIWDIYDQIYEAFPDTFDAAIQNAEAAIAALQGGGFCSGAPSDTPEWNNQALLDEGIITETEFYNPIREPNTYEFWNQTNNLNNAQKTKVLDIDIEKLRDYLTQTGQPFNGVIYIENLPGMYSWNPDTYKDFSVRIINAGILPENGLTIVTPHNIYVQGSFNLDYSRDKENGSPHSDAYDYYKSVHGGSDTDYVWHPAALISTNRLIYTVSDDFNTYIMSRTSLNDIAPINYWRPDNSYNYPYSLRDPYFLATYLNSKGLTGAGAPQTVRDFFTAHNLILPSEWTVDNIQSLMDTSVYPDAGTAQSSLLYAGEGQYDIDTASRQPNLVTHDVVYNTALVSPFDPQGYTLERWRQDSYLKNRFITGSFIQLPDSYRDAALLSQPAPMAYVVTVRDAAGNIIKRYWEVEPGYNTKTFDPQTGTYIDSGSYHYGCFQRGYLPSPYFNSYYGANNTFGYEPNFATSGSQGSGSATATAVGSWFEIPNVDFCLACVGLNPPVPPIPVPMPPGSFSPKDDASHGVDMHSDHGHQQEISY